MERRGRAGEDFGSQKTHSLVTDGWRESRGAVVRTSKVGTVVFTCKEEVEGGILSRDKEQGRGRF